MTQTKEQRKIYQTKYDLEHRDIKSNYNKTYRDKTTSKANRHKLESVTITCVCGCVIRKYGLSQHLSTKKHINLMKPSINN
tara:strand:- start:869 stop:1111 length:243 start_codon:yes stop_codon:yes gene_type:complete